MLHIKGMVNCGHLTSKQNGPTGRFVLRASLRPKRFCELDVTAMTLRRGTHMNFQTTIFSDMQMQDSAVIKQLNCSPVLLLP